MLLNHSVRGHDRRVREVVRICGCCHPGGAYEVRARAGDVDESTRPGQITIRERVEIDDGLRDGGQASSCLEDYRSSAR